MLKLERAELLSAALSKIKRKNEKNIPKNPFSATIVPLTLRKSKPHETDDKRMSLKRKGWQKQGPITTKVWINRWSAICVCLNVYCSNDNDGKSSSLGIIIMTIVLILYISISYPFDKQNKSIIVVFATFFDKKWIQ